MSVKIRLQRHGKKGKPYFHIVVADARAPRDGRYIERLGMYNPNTDPATIEIDVDSASSWLQKGAQPTDTARAILSYRGVLYRNHLNRGVLKGALTQEEADKKFEAWVKEKDAKVQAKIDRLANESDSDRKARLAAEAEVSKKREADIAAKNAPEPEPAAEVEAPAAEAEEAVAEEAPAEEAEVKEEAAPEAKEEAPAEEVKEEAAPEAREETPAEEVKEEAAPEAKEEAPAEEVKEEAAPEAKEEAPAEEAKKEAPEAKEEAAPAEEPVAEEKADDAEDSEEKKA
jgi:small subunit ribosomal protein S16